MAYRFPNLDSSDPDWSIIPESEPIPADSVGVNLGGGAGRVLVMNSAAFAQYRADVCGFMQKITITGALADIPFSEE